MSGRVDRWAPSKCPWSDLPGHFGGSQAPGHQEMLRLFSLKLKPCQSVGKIAQRAKQRHWSELWPNVRIVDEKQEGKKKIVNCFGGETTPRPRPFSGRHDHDLTRAQNERESPPAESGVKSPSDWLRGPPSPGAPDWNHPCVGGEGCQIVPRSSFCFPLSLSDIKIAIPS